MAEGFPNRHDGSQSWLGHFLDEETNAERQLHWARNKLKCSDQLMIGNMNSPRASLKPGSKTKLIMGNHASHSESLV